MHLNLLSYIYTANLLLRKRNSLVRAKANKSVFGVENGVHKRKKLAAFCALKRVLFALIMRFILLIRSILGGALMQEMISLCHKNLGLVSV